MSTNSGFTHTAGLFDSLSLYRTCLVAAWQYYYLDGSL